MPALRRILLLASLVLAAVACTPRQADRAAADTPRPPAGTVVAAPLPVGVPDGSCRVASDCAVKNVGNCCGYFPACVNKDSPVDPEAVRAGCADSGLASVCGWKDIQACDCVQGQCRSVDGPVPVEQ